ncbi:MAG: hypothetical protein K9I94_06460 [Bacteroidales bacterium]|nr:hypothetical protein [Bacteroidales bacterium]
MLLSCSTATKDETTYVTCNTGDYLAQEPPGDSAVVFNASRLVEGMACRDIAISPDGDKIYFRTTAGNRYLTTILMTERTEQGWLQPEVAHFARDPQYDYMEPAFTPNGNKLFFATNQPMSATSNASDFNIWYTEKQNGSWSKPKPLGTAVNTGIGEYFPSLAEDGTLYFTRTNTKERTDFIYRSRLIKDQYQPARKLPEPINSGTAQFNAFIAPDESYIIVPVYGRDDSFGGCDYYISYRDEQDHWTELEHLPKPINSEDPSEWSPYVSSDGNYFFFMSARKMNRQTIAPPLTFDRFVQLHRMPQNGNSAIYWTEAGFIEK